MITRIRGLDFTASSTGGKQNHLVEALLSGHVLRIESVNALAGVEALNAALRAPGQWVMGVDFPFGLPIAFVEAMGWGAPWESYARQALSMSMAEFREEIDAFRVPRPDGQKQPKRRTDILASAQSPLTTVRTPVAYMFHAGVRSLLDAPVSVPPLREGLAAAVVVEAYPALVARRLIGGNRYKDAEPSERAGAREARRTMLKRLVRGDLRADFGFAFEVPPAIEEQCLNDDRGDVLDSLLCALQAGWASTCEDRGWGTPAGFADEGWICDPALVRTGPGERPAAVEAPPSVSVPKGSFNSSLTRVQPVFRHLLQADESGKSWIPNLLRLAARNRDAATKLADEFTSLSPESIVVRQARTAGAGRAPLEGCFEREFSPPLDLLRWCIDHPERLIKPRDGTSIAKSVRGSRAHLLSGDAARVAPAQAMGRAQLAQRGPEGSSRQWWAFEGFTSVDCSLETDEFILLIEGKRFEPVSSTVSWIDGRNQIARNLEVASTYAAARNKAWAVLLIGPDGTTPPSDDELKAGWPHLADDARNNLLAHFLGATSWPAVCQACGLDYDGLPLTTADLTEQTL